MSAQAGAAGPRHASPRRLRWSRGDRALAGFIIANAVVVVWGIVSIFAFGG